MKRNLSGFLALSIFGFGAYLLMAATPYDQTKTNSGSMQPSAGNMQTTPMMHTDTGTLRNDTGTMSAAKLGVVNFKACVDQSKLGKQEQANFEALKKQMETILEGKEKIINETANKLSDPDYLDSLSPDAETEQKRKLRSLGQEFAQLQAQYYQALEQARIKVVQKITEIISNAAEKISKERNIDIIFNEEGTFYYSPKFDLSKYVIAEMDVVFDRENNKQSSDQSSAAPSSSMPSQGMPSAMPGIPNYSPSSDRR